MNCVILLVGSANGVPTIFDGQFVVRFDFTRQTAPHGLLTTTRDVDKAKRFLNMKDAMLYWKQSHGFRPDGKPNRPLTAWTVEIMNIRDKL